MKTTRVGSYCIHINKMGRSLPALLQKGYSGVYLLTDSNTREHCLSTFSGISGLDIDHIIEIPSGENHKNIETCRLVWKEMLEKGADRNSLLINLGGGMICDLGGFCASTYMRGIDFVQVPTTLLAQVDASVGGKLGVDFMGYKNLLGLFKDPTEIYLEFEFLKSLPKRELQSGFVEIIKHALIESPGTWNKLKKKRPTVYESMMPFINKSILIKKQVVETDPYEEGIRKILNFGHTIGHAIETLYLRRNDPKLHGECVAAGMICETYISQKTFGFEEGLLDDVCEMLEPYTRHISIGKEDFDELLELLKKDKKNTGGNVQFSLIKDIGAARYNIEVDRKLVRESLKYFSDVKKSAVRGI